MGRLGLTPPRRNAAEAGARVDPVDPMFLRHASPLLCAGYLVAWWGVLAVFTCISWGQYGRPRSWPVARRATVTIACCIGALVWLWIDKRVEVAVLLQVYREHGVTLGDLLAVPPLALGAKAVLG
jgi:hypothetical protein